MFQASRVTGSGMRSKSSDAERLNRLTVELTEARDLAHAVADSDHIVYMIEMALLEVADRSRVGKD